MALINIPDLLVEIHTASDDQVYWERDDHSDWGYGTREFILVTEGGENIRLEVNPAYRSFKFTGIKALLPLAAEQDEEDEDGE